MKYKLTKNSIEVCGKKLFQIKATVSFGNVKKGELGGYIEKYENLNQEGNAWVSGNAWVYGNACVSGDARVYGNAWVYGNACVSGDAWVYGNAWVSGNACVSGDARVYGNAWVSGNAWVYGNACVSGDACVSGNARVYGDAWVYGKLKILAGCFFGMRYNKEEIKYKENEGQELIYKGEAKFEEEKESLSGKKVSVELDGVKYTATID